MVFAEVIRFVLPRSPAATRAFVDLRTQVANVASVKNQYFGYVLQNEGYPTPKPEDQMCWYIEWSGNEQHRLSEAFIKSLNELAKGRPKKLSFRFFEANPGGVVRALESKVCQFAVIKLNAAAPRFNTELEQSMHKTFTDCYLAKGFIDGGWGYALNSNDADGEDLSVEENVLDEKDRRLAYYPLGWNSLEDHHAYARTELFDEEIDKLKKYFAAGSGAWYVRFERHI